MIEYLFYGLIALNILVWSIVGGHYLTHREPTVKVICEIPEYFINENTTCKIERLSRNG